MGTSSIKIHFIRSSKPRSAVLEGLYGVLSQRGFAVTEGIPEKAAWDLDLAPRHDLYVLKARSELSMSVAGVLHQRGGRLLNPYPSCVVVLNKIVATAMMRNAGIPTPHSWATVDPSLLRSVAIAQHMPLILKPFNGIHSQGLTVVRRPDDLAGLPIAQRPMLVQEFVDGCTERFKVHCVGHQVYATRKPFSLGGTHVPGEPCEVSDELRDVAQRCGRLFGMGLYGLDILMGRSGPMVVDVNSFPGYKGLPSMIAKVIADYIQRYAHGRIDLPSN